MYGSDPLFKKIMTPEELLKERYKVIAPDTSGRWPVGEVYTFNREVAQTYDYWINSKGEGVTFNFFSAFPHLFKPLAWYEEREVGEMPQYVRNEDGEIIKILSWEKKDNHGLTPYMIGYIIDERPKYSATFSPNMEPRCLPAKEEEYLSYLK